MTTVSPSGSFLQNNALLIHIGVEIVVLGGITFWFNKRTSSLEEQIVVLTDKLTKHEELIIKQGEIITQHENMMREMYAIIHGGSPQRSSVAQPLQRGPPRVAPQPKRNTSPNQPSQPTPRSNIPKTFKNVEKQVEEVDENELDDLMAEELAELNRQDIEGAEYDEEEYCDTEGNCGKKKR